MDILHYAILVLVGAAAGTINVLAGGGSLLTVPAMIFLDIPAPIANGTNRIAMAAQGISAFYTFFRKGFSDVKLSFTLSVSMLPGGIIGAHIGTHLEGVWFNRLLALIMVAVMLSMALKGNKPAPAVESAHQVVRIKRPVLTHILMFCVGFYGGIIHIGIGLLIIPILHRVAELDLVRVNMHKMTVIFPYSVAAIAIYATESGVLWVTGLTLALGNAFGGWLGAHLTMAKGERLVRITFNIVLAILIVKLLFFF